MQCEKQPATWATVGSCNTSNLGMSGQIGAWHQADADDGLLVLLARL
jgi:hypothetical protein